MKTPDTPSPHDNHNHHHNARSNPFLFPFYLTLAFAIVELAGGIWTKSLALQGDAWHMFSDVFALGLAMFASRYAAQSTRKKHASGQSHAELVASVINAVLMLIVVIYIIAEALHRLKNPQDITGVYVMLIAFIGLVVNIIVAKRLHGGGDHHNDHNRRAALIHVIGDLLGSIAALTAGAVIYFSGWLAIDPLLSIFISLLILVVTFKLIHDIWQTLRQR